MFTITPKPNIETEFLYTISPTPNGCVQAEPAKKKVLSNNKTYKYTFTPHIL